MLEWIIENKELLKFLYTFLIAFICAIIVIKTDRLFNISSHQGIQYLRNAFLFYGIGFILRSLLEIEGLSFGILHILFEFFLIMAGFFLLYSLLWKRLEISSAYTSSLLKPWILLFYLMALIIALIDHLWVTYVFMFFSQIVLFVLASIISLKNYRKNGSKHKFLKFYFIAMLLSLGAWSLNAFAAIVQWRLRFVTGVYLINIAVFLLFLYGVIKVTKK